MSQPPYPPGTPGSQGQGQPGQPAYGSQPRHGGQRNPAPPAYGSQPSFGHPAPPVQQPGQPGYGSQPRYASPQGGAPQAAPPQPAGTPPRHPSGVEQRQYQQPRFYPTVTQEMRIRAQIQQPAYRSPPQQMVWAKQARKQPMSGRAVFGTVAVCLLGLLMLVVLGVYLLFLGPSLFLVIPLALIPLSAIVLTVWFIDSWKRQPYLLLAICLLWGSAVSIVMTLVIGLTNEVLAQASSEGQSGSNEFVGAVIQAPLVEETTKGMLLLIILFAARKHFDGPLQGLIYGSLIGAGFAFTENVQYFGLAFADQGGMGLAMTFLMRAIMSPLGHTVFTGATGIIMGFGARRGGYGPGVGMFFVGLPVAMLLHALWNFTATAFPDDMGLFGLLVSACLSVLFIAGWFTAAFVLRRNEVVRARAHLGDYANAGWLSHAEVHMLGTWAGRRQGRAWASQFGAKPVMKQMIKTSSQLASIRGRILVESDARADQQEERTLLDAFAAERRDLMRASGAAR